MSIRQVGLGTEVKFAFKYSGTPSASIVLHDGVVTPVSVEILPVAGAVGWCTASIIPVETGVFDVIVEDERVGTVEVVTKDIFTFLRNLEDQALGGWEWNKTSTIMTLYRQDGSVLGTFECSDGLESGYSRPVVL